MLAKILVNKGMCLWLNWQAKKTLFTYPTERYLNVIKCGYKDCNLDRKYLKKALVSV